MGRRSEFGHNQSVQTKVEIFTHHFHSAEHVTEVVATLQILGNVSKSAEVIWVLGST